MENTMEQTMEKFIVSGVELFQSFQVSRSLEVALDRMEVWSLGIGEKNDGWAYGEHM